MTKNILKIICIFVIGTVGGIFADQILWPYFIERPLFLEYRLEPTPVTIHQTKEVIVEENTAFQETIKKVQQEVVGLKVSLSSEKTLYGSGLVITSDGLVVTLSDLVPSKSQTIMIYDGEVFSSSVVKESEDLALLKMEKENLGTLGFADFSNINLGQRIFLVGNRFNQDGSCSKMVNQGIIRQIDSNLIYTNISENESLQGSPLFNIQGEVIGLNMIDSEGKVTTIPSSQIQKLLNSYWDSQEI